MVADLRGLELGGETDRILSVDVCVCTYRRVSLEATLRSLAGQQAVPAGGFRVIVADNDESPTAQALAARLATELGLDLLYVHAPARNISVARNACLTAARAPLLAFIDDDEEASPTWLQNLVLGLEQMAVDVVFGPVQALYRDDAPAWMRGGDFHSIRAVRLADGRIETGYTCNVLMRRDRVGELRFDPVLGRSGGEDTVFFHQLAMSGASFGFQADAWASEVVPDARARLSWLLRRGFRSGQTHARILRLRGRRRLPRAAEALAKAAYCAGGAGLNLFSSTRRNQALVRGALHMGVVSGLLGAADLQLY